MQKKLLNRYVVEAVTDVGLVHLNNEDNILIEEDLALLIVADGMGGHQAGEIASMEAISIIQQMLKMQQRNRATQKGIFGFVNKMRKKTLGTREKEQSLEKALFEANQHVYQLNVERNAVNGVGMGTTVAGCWLIAADMMLVFHIGDSRVYRYRDQKLERLSKDHSMLQQWHDNGCIGEQPKSNVILKAIGPYSEVTPEIQLVSIEENDAFLLCSDGLTDMVDDSEIEKTLQDLSVEQIENMSQKLLQSALEQGGKDNISIMLMMQC